MTKPIPRSALALIEKPEGFIMQKRPNLPGRLPYPGKIHFFGGGVETGETAYDALRRELGEKTKNLKLSTDAEEPLWEGYYLGEDKHGQPLGRHISLFGVVLDSRVTVVPSRLEGGGVIEVPNDLERIADLRPEMAPFAYEALSTYVRYGEILVY